MEFDTVTIGDTRHVLTVEIVGLADLIAVQVVNVHIWRPGDEAFVIDGSVVDAVARTITFDIGSFLTDEATEVAVYDVEYQLGFFDANEETWPPEPDKLPVRAPGA